MLISFALALVSAGTGSVRCDEHSVQGEPHAIRSAWQKVEEPQAKNPPSPSKHESELKSDIEIGKKASIEVEKEFKLSKNAGYQARVQKIGEELATIANNHIVRVTWGDKRLNKFDYTIKVVEDKEVNAFSLPGGFLYVYEGLVKYAETDDELAGVLAHEIAHASFRHVAELTREQSKFDLQTLPLVLIAVLGGSDAGTGGLILRDLVSQAKASGWGQKAELSADLGAIQYLQFSRYNPVGMLTFMERLARDKRALEAIDWGIYRTHPPSRERADKMIEYFKSANVPIKRSQVSTSFRAIPEPDSQANVAIRFNGWNLFTFGGDSAMDRAKAAAAKLNEFFDQVPELYDLNILRDGSVIGRRKLIFKINADDADASGKSLDTLINETRRSIKNALYVMAYRVWDFR